MTDRTYLINRATFVAEILSGNNFAASSEGCSPNGSGQCDGYDYDEDMVCDCPCHVGEDPLFEVTTVAEFKAAHDTMWNWGA